MDADRAGGRGERSRPHRTGSRRAVVRLLVAALTGLTAWGAPVGASADDTADSPGGANGESTPVVFVGVAGLEWPDVTQQDMPTLYDLAGSDAAASLTVRTVQSRTCVVDGWLTVNAGSRATDLYDTDGDDEGDRFCREPRDPVADDDGGVVVPGWQALRRQQEENSYNAQIGMLGDRLAKAGLSPSKISWA